MPYKVGFETENDLENSRAAAGHKKCPVSRQKIKTFSFFLAGPRCTWVHKPGIAASGRIYRCSIRWKIRKCFICETCTSLDEHLNSCCKGRRQWFNKVHKDEDSRVHEHQVWQTALWTPDSKPTTSALTRCQTSEPGWCLKLKQLCHR